MASTSPNNLIIYRSPQAFQEAYQQGVRPRLLWTRHALERFVSMKKQGLTADEITDAVCAPDDVGYMGKYDAVLLNGSRVTLSVVIAEDGYPAVATVLWRTADAWRASYEVTTVRGRERRADLSHLPSGN